MADARFDPGPALAPLKAFQRATVDHVCRRLLTDPDDTRQFLVADEVGLGKTMVARGVIACTIGALLGKVPRIDIIYVCSNGAIAEQNLRKLLVTPEPKVRRSTRLTLLALDIQPNHETNAFPVRYVSLTPDTSFNLKSSGGWARERSLILKLLEGQLAHPKGAIRLFQGWSGEPGWERERARVATETVDPEIAARFQIAVAKSPGLTARIDDLLRRGREAPSGRPRPAPGLHRPDRRVARNAGAGFSPVA